MSHNVCDVCNNSKINEYKCVCSVSCISWSAVLIGALFILGLSFLLHLFGATIGLSAFHLSPEGVKTLALGGFIGMLIGTIAVMFFSGWIAGYLGRTRCVTGYCGSLYGFSAWSVALIVTILLSAHVGKFVTSFNDFVQTPSYSNIAVTTNNAAPVISTNNANASQVLVNSDKVAMGAFAIFILFLVGAFSSAIGGHCGLRTCCKKSKCQHTMIDKGKNDGPSSSA